MARTLFKDGETYVCADWLNRVDQLVDLFGTSASLDDIRALLQLIDKNDTDKFLEKAKNLGDVANIDLAREKLAAWSGTEIKYYTARQQVNGGQF